MSESAQLYSISFMCVIGRGKKNTAISLCIVKTLLDLIMGIIIHARAHFNSVYNILHDASFDFVVMLSHIFSSYLDVCVSARCFVFPIPIIENTGCY